MSYSDQKMSGGKISALVLVVLIHLALGYAFVTGLAYQYIQKAKKDMNTFDVQEPPPPPPDVPPPPPPPDQKFVPPPVVMPPPIVATRTLAPPIQMTPTAPPAPPVPPPPPAPPAPPHISQAAKSKGDPKSWFSTDDYPPAALRAQAEGRVVARLNIGADGRVSGCTVTSSSGNGDLDGATCRVAQRRGRYTPAKDENGAGIAATDNISIRWVVPKE